MEYACNVDIKLIPFKICLIHKTTYSFRFITLEILDDSSDSKTLIKIYSLSCCCIYKKKKTRRIGKKDSATRSVR